MVESCGDARTVRARRFQCMDILPMTTLDAIAKAIQHADTQAKIRWIETGATTEDVFIAMARAALHALGLREIVDALNNASRSCCSGGGWCQKCRATKELITRLRPLLAAVEGKG